MKCFFCLADHRSVAETAVELMRPHLHELLTSAYSDYDIVIWCEFVHVGPSFAVLKFGILNGMDVLLIKYTGVPRWQPHRHSGLANLHSVGAIPHSGVFRMCERRGFGDRSPPVDPGAKPR